MQASEYSMTHNRRDVARLHELWATGVPLADIAAEFGVAVGTVSKWAQRYKLPRRTCNPAQEPEAPTPADEEASASGLALAPAIEARARECRERHYAERRAERADNTRPRFGSGDKEVQHDRVPERGGRDAWRRVPGRVRHGGVDGLVARRNDWRRVVNEPVAWGIDCDGKLLSTYTCEDEESAREMVARFSLSGIGNIAAIPLYRQPQPAITDAEREAILAMACHCDTRSGLEWVRLSATLRGLLERMK